MCLGDAVIYDVVDVIAEGVELDDRLRDGDFAASAFEPILGDGVRRSEEWSDHRVPLRFLRLAVDVSEHDDR